MTDQEFGVIQKAALIMDKYVEEYIRKSGQNLGGPPTTMKITPEISDILSRHGVTFWML